MISDPGSGDEHPDILRMINATSDSVLHAPAYVREQERRIAQLSPCTFASLARNTGTHVMLTPFPVGLWIPGLPSAEPMEVPPDNRWHGWRWSTHEFLLLHMDPDPEFAASTHPGPKSCKAAFAGRLMEVRRVAPGDPGWAANAYAAEISGYLDDATLFWAQIVGLPPIS